MQQNQNDKRYQALSPQAKDSFKTLVEANNYNNTEQMELLNNTAQTKGMDKNGNTERGKVGITKKVVKQACNSLPTKVKKKIGTQSKFYAAVKAVDHFTGDVEDEIYKQMKGLGLSDNYAWIATKAITLIIWFCCKVKIICTSIQNYKSKYCFNSKEFC
ncbi:hypothetical protein [Staphylococcus epidermidis]|uniref:hypothetical protein n=1 Tax=Staphylococcus epidermidis TaxID=1282 RepID=UPI001E3C78D1|nr:hypothetical protein [Staphylococcus epidermidis]